MKQRTLSSTLSNDFGAPAPVVKMSPGGRATYNAPPPPMAPYLPGAQELNDDHTRVSAGEAARTVWPAGTKESREDQRKYNDWQRQQKAEQEAAHGAQSLADQAIGLVAGGKAEAIVRGPQGADHYQYLQYPDNGVRVIKNTKTKTDLDVYYAPGSQASKNVIATYGPHPASVAGAPPASQPQQDLTVGEKLAKAASVGAEIFQASDLSTAPAEEEKKSNTLLYIGLGVGGVAVLGLLVMAMKQKD